MAQYITDIEFMQSRETVNKKRRKPKHWALSTPFLRILLKSPNSL